jgi:hypothetical protein
MNSIAFALQKKSKLNKIKIDPIGTCELPHYIKSPVYLESQCYPAKKTNLPLKKNAIVSLRHELTKALDDLNIHIVGINFSISELRAFRAIQKLFTLMNYQGNVPEMRTFYDGNNPFHFIGFITPLKVKVADFLRAYGVNTKLKKDGKIRFNSHEREEALKALAHISSKIFYFYFSKKHITATEPGESKKSHIDIIQTIAPLFKYHRQKPQDETADKHASRTDYIIIEPTPIMLYGVENDYMLIPPYETEIRSISKGKRIPKEVYTFVGYLIYQAEIQRKKKYRDWLTITIDIELLIYKLRLEHYFSQKSRNPKKAYTIIECGIEYACKSGYVHSFIQEQEQERSTYIFYLNGEKFYPHNTLSH